MCVIFFIVLAMPLDKYAQFFDYSVFQIQFVGPLNYSNYPAFTISSLV